MIPTSGLKGQWWDKKLVKKFVGAGSRAGFKSWSIKCNVKWFKSTFKHNRSLETCEQFRSF